MVEPLCGRHEREDGGCWLPVGNRDGCYAWASLTDCSGRQCGSSSEVSFEGEGSCVGERLTGSGRLTWGADRFEGRFERGVKAGPFRETDSDGGFWEVSYVAGERHGPFIHSNAARDWRENGEFVRDKRHGRVVQTYGRKDGGGCGVEGRYGDGRKDGRWIWTCADGGVQERPFAAGRVHGLQVMVLPNGDRWETPFVQDRMHGTEVFLSSNGERRELEWLRHRPYQGEFTLSDDRGVQVVAATLVEGEVTALALPEAELVPVVPGRRRAPIDGAFGINLGPGGVDQLAALTCVARDGGDEIPCLTEIAGRLVLTGSSGAKVKQLPEGTVEGWDYSVRVTAETGVEGIRGEVFRGAYDDETWRACEDEAGRISASLRRKHGDCGAFQHFLNGVERSDTMIAQCDGEGLPVRYAAVEECSGYITRISVAVVYSAVPESDRQALREWREGCSFLRRLLRQCDRHEARGLRSGEPRRESPVALETDDTISGD